MTNARALVLGVMALALGACAQGAPRPSFAEPSFRHHQPIRLAVDEIEIVSDYRSPLSRPNVEHELPVAPERALRRWAAERLVAMGGPGRRARFVIEEAGVTETALARETGLRATFTTQQALRYDGLLRATLEIRTERANTSDGFATATVTRFRTVPENVSLNERDRFRHALVEGLMADFNAELERQIRANLAPFLR